MTSIGKYKIKDIQKKNPLFSAIRATVETAFYANNVEKIETVAEAYALAKETSGTIITLICQFMSQRFTAFRRTVKSLFSTMEKSSGELQRPGKLLANQA